MRHFDLTPLYRSTIGFDRLGSLLDTLGAFEGDTPSYPPYNIERVGENEYRISMAVAGFGEKRPHHRGEGEHALHSRREADRGRGEPPSASRHRLPQLRAQVPARRPCRGEGREPREWLAARRPRARAARGDEAPHHPDRDQEPTSPRSSTARPRNAACARPPSRRALSPKGAFCSRCLGETAAPFSCSSAELLGLAREAYSRRPASFESRLCAPLEICHFGDE